VYTNYGTGYRVPSLAELFGSSALVRGNARLRPEEATTAEVGARWTARRSSRVSAPWIDAAAFLRRSGIEPAPERNRKRTWKQFLRSHWDTLYACDFFAVETLGFFGTVRYLVFFVVELKSRAAQVAGIRVDPGGAWMLQVARTLLDPVDGFLRNATHLIHDRDPGIAENRPATLAAFYLLAARS
jgi:hypothetical protein